MLCARTPARVLPADCEGQMPLLEKDIYFYDPVVREKYLPWAKVNI